MAKFNLPTIYNTPATAQTSNGQKIAQAYVTDDVYVDPHTGSSYSKASTPPVYLRNSANSPVNTKTNTSAGNARGSGGTSNAPDYQGMLDDLYNKVMGYGGYSYTPYTPGTYSPTVDTSATQAALQSALGDIQGYGDFKYDLNADMLYQNALDNYMMQGQQAMMDTNAAAAALTGGYGNSWAASVGNQAYQNYITQANNMIPQFQQMAMNVWQSGLDRRKDVYDAVSQQLANELSLEDMAFAIWAQNEANAANAHNMNSQGAYNSWLAGYNQLMDQYNLGVDYIGQLQALNKPSSEGSSNSTSSNNSTTILNPTKGQVVNPSTGKVVGTVTNPLDWIELLDKANTKK